MIIYNLFIIYVNNEFKDDKILNVSFFMAIYIYYLKYKDKR